VLSCTPTRHPAVLSLLPLAHNLALHCNRAVSSSARPPRPLLARLSLTCRVNILTKLVLPSLQVQCLVLPASFLGSPLWCAALLPHLPSYCSPTRHPTRFTFSRYCWHCYGCDLLVYSSRSVISQTYLHSNMIHSTFLCVCKRVVLMTQRAVLARFRGCSAVPSKQPPMCVQCYRTDFRSYCADDGPGGLKEKHHQFLGKRERQGESTRQKEEDKRPRASAKKNIKLIKKARQRDD